MFNRNVRENAHVCFTCSSRSSTFLCQPSLAAIISSSFCWEICVSAACLSASYSSVSSSFNKRTSSLQKKTSLQFLLIVSGSLSPLCWIPALLEPTPMQKPCYVIVFISCHYRSLITMTHWLFMPIRSVIKKQRGWLEENKWNEQNKRMMPELGCSFTAMRLSISAPSHLPSCPSSVSLRFWWTSLGRHAAVSGSQSPPAYTNRCVCQFLHTNSSILP